MERAGCDSARGGELKFWNGQAYKTNHYLDNYDIECSDKAYKESLKYFKKPKKKNQAKLMNNKVEKPEEGK